MDLEFQHGDLGEVLFVGAARKRILREVDALQFSLVRDHLLHEVLIEISWLVQRVIIEFAELDLSQIFEGDVSQIYLLIPGSRAHLILLKLLRRMAVAVDVYFVWLEIIFSFISLC